MYIYIFVSLKSFLFFISENYETADAKIFFETNYSHIYFVFNDNFATVEADLKQRGK